MGADHVIGPWRAAHGGGDSGLPAHVTILYPFVPRDAVAPAVVEALTEIAASATAFPVRLATLGRFPRALWLAPEPAEPFVHLTEAVVAEWPSFPPYGGAFESIIPHVTVADGDEPPHLAAEIEETLPIEGRASELWLMAQDRGGRWRALERLPLG